MWWRVRNMSIWMDFSSSLMVLAVSSLAIGLVFDRWEVGRWRSVLIGLLASAGVVALVAVHGLDFRALAPAAGAILLVAGLFGAPLAVGIALILPLSLCLELGGMVAAQTALMLMGAGLVGAAINRTCRSLSWTLQRRCVLIVGLASPICLVVPLAMAAPHETMRDIVSLAAQLALASVLFGLLTFNERARAHAERHDCREDETDNDTSLVTPDLFDSQLRHHFELHDRYGVQFGCLVVGIDQKGALRAALPAAAWQRARSQVARLVRAKVRECDVCCAHNTADIRVLLPYVGIVEMRRVATRIRDGIAEAAMPFEPEISVSVGMAHVSEANSADDLRLLADNALVVARTAHPRGAIGPAWPDTDSPSVVRSFPGRVLTPSACNIARRGGETLSTPADLAA